MLPRSIRPGDIDLVALEESMRCAERVGRAIIGRRRLLPNHRDLVEAIAAVIRQGIADAVQRSASERRT